MALTPMDASKLFQCNEAKLIFSCFIIALNFSLLLSFGSSQKKEGAKHPITMNKKETHWFSHDKQARNEPRLKLLNAKFGRKGYGNWWVLLEVLRDQEAYKYDITSRIAYTLLAQEFEYTVEETKDFITTCIEELELLQTDGNHIWSNDLLERMEYLDKKRATLSERGKRGAATTNAKRSAQAKTSDGTSAAIKLNKTKQKQTTEISKQTPLLKRGGDISPTGEIGVVTTPGTTTAAETIWQSFKTNALADTNFTYTLVSGSNISEAQLEKWLTTFNRILTFRGEAPKSEGDYRMHFKNWFKFRDPAKEDPDKFLVPEIKNKAPVVIATNTFLKTPQQIEEEQKQRRRGTSG